RRRVLAASVGPSPEAGPRICHRTGDAHDPTDDSILVQEAEPAEEVGPVVLAPADEGQFLSLGVLDVDGNVQEILRDPPQRDGGRVPIAASPEVRHERGGHDELHQRPTQEADELAEDSEQWVPELVDREIEAVELLGGAHSLTA